MPEKMIANKTDLLSFPPHHILHSNYLPLSVILILPPQREASEQPDQIVQNMPEMANLVYNMYMHMIQTSQKYRQVRTFDNHSTKTICRCSL